MTFKPLEGMRDRGRLILEYMQAKGYSIRAWNIVYLEGIDTDLKTLNSDRVDGWNDVRVVVTDDGDVLMSAQATTEPGWYYRKNRMNPKGAAQVAFGQYLECWQIGRHYTQDALVQCGNITVFRDSNEDGKRTGDPIEVGDWFGINQHTTSNAPNTVGLWSAGCLVGRFPSTHTRFMAICRAMGRRRFDSTLIAGDDFISFEQRKGTLIAR